MHKHKTILVGVNAPTVEGRIVSEYDEMLFVVDDGSFTSLGNYYLWLLTGNELLRHIPHVAGLRLIKPETQFIMNDTIARSLYDAVYMKLYKLTATTQYSVDNYPISNSKGVLKCLYSTPTKDRWFEQFIDYFNRFDNRVA